MLAQVTGQQPLTTNTAPRGFDVKRIVLDSDKITEATGWSASIPLQNGIEHLWTHLGNKKTTGWNDA